MNCAHATELQHSPELCTVCPQNALVSHQALPKVAGQVSHQALPKMSTLTCTTAQTGHKHHAMRFPPHFTDTLQGLEERNPGKVAPREDDATMCFPPHSTDTLHIPQTPYTFHRHSTHSTDTLHIPQTPSTFHRHPTGFGRKKTRQKLHQAKGRRCHNAFPSTQCVSLHIPQTPYRVWKKGNKAEVAPKEDDATVECRWTVALLCSIQH